MLRFDGIDIGIEGREYGVGTIGEALNNEQVNDLVSETITVLQEHMDHKLQYLRVVLDDVEYGLSDVATINGVFIDMMALKLRNFLSTELVRDMLNNGN